MKMLEWGKVAEEDVQGSKRKAVWISRSNHPPLCLAGAENGAMQGGGGLHEESEGTSGKFNYRLDLYVEIYLWIHI